MFRFVPALYVSSQTTVTTTATWADVVLQATTRRERVLQAATTTATDFKLLIDFSVEDVAGRTAKLLQESGGGAGGSGGAAGPGLGTSIHTFFIIPISTRIFLERKHLLCASTSPHLCQDYSCI